MKSRALLAIVAWLPFLLLVAGCSAVSVSVQMGATQTPLPTYTPLPTNTLPLPSTATVASASPTARPATVVAPTVINATIPNVPSGGGTGVSPTLPLTVLGTATRPPASATATRPSTGDTSLVFSDDFSTCSDLPIGDNDRRTYQCENGEYTMLGKSNNSRWVFYDNTYTDVVLEVDGRAISGPSFIEYGVAVRISSDGNRYFGFTVTRNGKFSFFRYEDPDFIDLISFTLSDAVKSDTGRNHFKIVVQGNQFGLYINDVWLNTVSDSTLQSGTIGLFTNNEEPNAKVGFSNLRVSQINRTISLPAGKPTPKPTAAPATATLRPTAPPQPTATRPPAPNAIPGCNLGPGEAGLLISNSYSGVMRFTIGGGEWGTHDYDVANDGQRHLIKFPPGRYTYTAFIPGAGKDQGEPFQYNAGTCRILDYRP